MAKLNSVKLGNYRALWFAQCWLGMRSLKMPVVADAAADALEIAHPKTKTDRYDVLKAFQQTFKHTQAPATSRFVPRRPTVTVQPKKTRRTKPPRITRPSVDVNSEAFLASYEWRVLRMIVLKKYGATCQCCGATRKDGIKIHVDHIKSRRKHPELALMESNLQVLCEVCNHGKSTWDETDWRDDSQLSGESSRTPLVTRSGDGDEQVSKDAVQGTRGLRLIKEPKKVAG